MLERSEQIIIYRNLDGSYTISKVPDLTVLNDLEDVKKLVWSYLRVPERKYTNVGIGEEGPDKWVVEYIDKNSVEYVKHAVFSSLSEATAHAEELAKAVE